MKLTLESLKAENFGWHELPGGHHIRSNEFPGDVWDIVYHKNKSTLNDYYKIFTHFTPESVFEIGVMEGGSLVLWNTLFNCKVVGVDCTSVNFTPSFRKYQRKETCDVGKQDIVTIILDVYNAGHLDEVADREFPEGIDFIVDDGPHDIRSMRSNFNVLWPKLKKGGFYSIEDWQALPPKHIIELYDVLDRVATLDGVSTITYPNFIGIHK